MISRNNCMWGRNNDDEEQNNELLCANETHEELSVMITEGNGNEFANFLERELGSSLEVPDIVDLDDVETWVIGIQHEFEENPEEACAHIQPNLVHEGMQELGNSDAPSTCAQSPPLVRLNDS
ncbi:hypothetical protein QAD02_014991 [Eretmocerus hayati]|uniref:Uncharacterized protein n=1 Tax=Eretmocerus hayati TaxID=131215 RepID=A0ACC2P9E2_9HYME|nr:hypothetical protein QAD02_014991 [Eretmocerus hayati]